MHTYQKNKRNSLSGITLLGTRDFFNDIGLRIQKQIHFNRQSHPIGSSSLLVEMYNHQRQEQQQRINKLDELKQKIFKDLFKELHQSGVHQSHFDDPLRGVTQYNISFTGDEYALLKSVFPGLENKNLEQHIFIHPPSSPLNESETDSDVLIEGSYSDFLRLVKDLVRDESKESTEIKFIINGSFKGRDYGNVKYDRYKYSIYFSQAQYAFMTSKIRKFRMKVIEQVGTTIEKIKNWKFDVDDIDDKDSSETPRVAESKMAYEPEDIPFKPTRRIQSVAESKMAYEPEDIPFKPSRRIQSVAESKMAYEPEGMSFKPSRRNPSSPTKLNLNNCTPTLHLHYHMPENQHVQKL